MKKWYLQTTLKHAEDPQIARILSRLILVSGATLFIIGLITMYLRDLSTSRVVGAGIILLAVTFWLVRRGHWQAGSLVIAIGMLMTVTLIATVGQGIYDLAVMAYPIIFIFAGLTLPRAYFGLSVGLTLIAVMWLALGDANGWFVPQPLFVDPSNRIYLIVVSIILLVAGVAVDLLARHLRNSLEQAHQEIERRQRAEEALQIKDWAIESAIDAIATADLDGNLTYMNAAFLKLSGYSSKAELLGNQIWEFCPNKEKIVELKDTLSTTGSWTGDLAVQIKDGSLLNVHVVSSVVMNGPGQSVCLQASFSDITEREKIAKELANRNVLLSALINSDNNIIIFALDTQHKYTVFNEKHRKTMKEIWKVDIELGHNMTDYMTASAPRELALQSIERAANGESFTEIQHQQTEDIYWEFTWAPIIQNGKVIGITNFCNNITERKRAEEALRESEETFRQLMTNSPILVYIKDENLRLLKVSENFKDLLGKPTRELLGKDSYDLLPPEFAKSAIADDLKVLEGGQVVTAEEKLNGRVYTTIKFPIHRGAGKPDYLGGFSVDISDRKKAEEALRESEKRLSSIFDSSGDIVFLLDLEKDGEYRFNMVNPAFLATTGLPSASVVGRNVKEIIPEPSLTLVLRKYEEAVRTKTIVHWEESSDYPSGKLTALVNIAPILDSDGKCYQLVGNVRDITERKRAEEAIRESESSLAEAQKLSRIGSWQWDMISNKVKWSDEMYRVFGISPYNYDGKPESLLKVIHPDDIEKYVNAMNTNLSGGRSPDLEYRVIHKDGEVTNNGEPGITMNQWP